MDFFETVQNRRSIREYQREHALSEPELNQLLDTVMLSPTSYNIQHWRLVRISNMALREKIQKAAWDQTHVTSASETFIFCADTNAWKKQPERYWQDAPEETQSMILPMIHDFYSGQAQLQRDEAIRSASIAAQTFMLTAKAMGYDTCPMIGFDSDKIAELIRLPEDHIVVMMITLGKATTTAHSRGGQLAREEVVIENRF